MGQRLNLEIVKSINSPDNVLANAYYRRSGFTHLANKLTNLILREIQNVSSEIMKIEDEKLKAVRLLELTGALIIEEEYYNISKKYQDEFFVFANIEDEGLIGVTNGGINEVRFWEDKRITIYLDEKIIGI